MPIMDDQKKAITTMIGRRNAKDGVSSLAPMKLEKSMDEDAKIDGRHAAAEDILMALHEKSPQKLMEALGNFHDLHMAMQAPEEPEEDL